MKDRRIDWVTTLVPFAIVLVLMALFMLTPDSSKSVIDSMRSFLGGKIGVYYSVLAAGSVFCALFLAFCPKYGKIRLGGGEKPQYSSFKWGTMIFTSTMAADILFYSLIEWALYGTEEHVTGMGAMELWAPTFNLFHWGPYAWGFYVILAVCFGYMMHVRMRNRQRFSEACRPLLGAKVDGFWGKIIDVTAIFAVVCATATTFSLATPLLTKAMGALFGFSAGTGVTICVLLLICAVYSIAVFFGISGISRIASICSYLFIALLLFVLLLGGECRFILVNGVRSLGNMILHFPVMSTYMDAPGEVGFAERWTIYYWAYWLVWSVATPFFIGLISKGRTIRNTVLGTFGWGLAGTYMSFIILGNYGVAQQFRHGLDVSGMMGAGADMYDAILQILGTLPLPGVALALLVVTMIAFYSTTLDSITYVASSYSYKRISADEEPSRKVRGFWSVMLIFLPIALLFSENSLYSLQGVTIIAAFPVGILLIMIVWSFFKDVRLQGKNADNQKVNTEQANENA